jgi:hypothetical protein
MIAWESDMEKALARAKAEQRCVLLEFFSPECIGCKQMDKVTFPSQEVSNFITDRMVPLRLRADHSKIAPQFHVFWTPTLVVMDLYGTEHQKTIGYIPPEEMVASLLLGIGKAAVSNGQYNEAVLQLNTLMNGYPNSVCAPEAVYLRAVSRYRSSHEAAALKDALQKLSTEYPNSEWTRRAEPFSLL